MIHSLIVTPRRIVPMRLTRLATLVTVAACSPSRPAAPPVVTMVELRLLPGDGRAWVSFDTTGVAKGGHFSGDTPPYVHLDSASISRDSARAIFAAVRAMGDSLLARRGPPVDSSRAGPATLAVPFSDSTQAQFVWTAVSQPSDARVQVVLEHLLANRVGGW